MLNTKSGKVLSQRLKNENVHEKLLDILTFLKIKLIILMQKKSVQIIYIYV